jgi:hypothetical protein
VFLTSREDPESPAMRGVRWAGTLTPRESTLSLEQGRHIGESCSDQGTSSRAVHPRCWGAAEPTSAKAGVR